MVNVFVYDVIFVHIPLYCAFSGCDCYICLLSSQNKATKVFSNQHANNHRGNKSDTDFVLSTNIRKLFGSM